MNELLLGGACVFAGVCGWFGWGAWSSLQRRMRYQRLVRESGGGQGDWTASWQAYPLDESSMREKVISYAIGVSQRVRAPSFHALAPEAFTQRPWVGQYAVAAGLSGLLNDEGFWESRVRLALIGGAAGLLIGLVITSEMGLLLAAVGCFVGWQALPWAIKGRVNLRTREMERHLSEMLDVVALGLRSGMSFDRSLELYTQHFRTLLADSFGMARRQWTCGLSDRADALRMVARSYDSALLARVIENIIRSLRFGSTLAENLEDAAKEARADYRARREEEVAKAPIKMMVPTGALILPAMLLLVLGPVLLELAGGF